MSKLHIRHPMLDDAARLAELTTTLGYASSPEVLLPRLERTLARQGTVVYVAEVDPGGVAGPVAPLAATPVHFVLPSI